jgi:hypothetical protein
MLAIVSTLFYIEKNEVNSKVVNFSNEKVSLLRRVKSQKAKHHQFEFSLLSEENFAFKSSEQQNRTKNDYLLYSTDEKGSLDT